MPTADFARDAKPAAHGTGTKGWLSRPTTDHNANDNCVLRDAVTLALLTPM